MNYQDLILKTERLELRPIILADAPAIFQILQKYPEVTDYLTFEPPKKQEETETFIGQATKNMKEQKGMCWVIHFQGKAIGVVGLDDIVFEKLAWKMGNCDLGYWLSPEYHRQGIMFEAVTEALRCVFEDLKLHKIYANHVTENEASGNLLQKLGFRNVGERREHFYRFDRWWNYTMYELINPYNKNK
jgi:ribosomal-protein-alanine N-acetyltransferase